MKTIELEKLKEQYRALQKDYKILYTDYVLVCRTNKKLGEEIACLKLRMGNLKQLSNRDNKGN